MLIILISRRANNVLISVLERWIFNIDPSSDFLIDSDVFLQAIFYFPIMITTAVLAPETCYSKMHSRLCKQPITIYSYFNLNP